MKIYLDSVSKAADSHDVDKAVHEGERGTYSVLEYVYKHLDEFRLIFCHSEGTEYEGYFDELARSLQSNIQVAVIKSMNFSSMYIAETDGSIFVSLLNMAKALSRHVNSWRM